MGNCFACLKTSSSSPSDTTHVLSNQPTKEKINHGINNLTGKLIYNPIIILYAETDELLHTTNLQHPKKSNSSNFRKTIVINGKANSNCSLIDEKTVAQTGTKKNKVLLEHFIKFLIILAKESQIADNAINKLFEEYKDECEDAILSDGIERLCTDLNYSPDAFEILVLAFCLEATQMCKFTRQEFIHGLKNLNATTIAELRLRLVEIVEKLKTDVDLFKQLYRFTFNFGLDEGSRILNLEMAMDLWKLVFTVHGPADDLLERWLSFLSKESIRGIQRDTWLMFQNFAECFDITSFDLYDSDEAW